MKFIDNRGRENNDPTPHVLHVERHSSESLEARLKSMIRHELSQKAGEAGFETIEEANDFDVEEPFDEDPYLSRYQVMEFEQPVSDAPDQPDSETPPPQKGGVQESDEGPEDEITVRST